MPEITPNNAIAKFEDCWKSLVEKSFGPRNSLATCVRELFQERYFVVNSKGAINLPQFSCLKRKISNFAGEKFLVLLIL